jgi:hypothetical protein
MTYPTAYTKNIFKVKIQLFVLENYEQDPTRIRMDFGLATWIRISGKMLNQDPDPDPH